jgi:hypothetical protein
VEIQDRKTHECPCGPMHAHDEPTTACQTVRAQHSRPQHLARTSLPSCSTFSRCPHTKRCTQLVASSATWHLRARRTLIQTNNHTGIQACSKQLPNIKSTNQDGDRQRRSELPYHTSRQEHKKTPRTSVLRGPSLLAIPLGFLERMPLRDSNCLAMRHSEKVSIHE